VLLAYQFGRNQTQCLEGGGGGKGVHGLWLVCRQRQKLQVCTRTAVAAEIQGAFTPRVETIALVPEVLTDLVCIALQGVMRLSLNHVSHYISGHHGSLRYSLSRLQWMRNMVSG